MAKYPRIKPITIAQQKASLKQSYPHLIVSIDKDPHAVDCIMKVKPSEESRIYTIRINYTIYHVPKVWLLDPPLEQYNGENPHHLFAKGFDKKGHPQLCVFDPVEDNWSAQKSLARVFVPWVITWLYSYEIWLITGEWVYPEAVRNNN